MSCHCGVCPKWLGHTRSGAELVKVREDIAPWHERQVGW